MLNKLLKVRARADLSRDVNGDLERITVDDIEYVIDLEGNFNPGETSRAKLAVSNAIKGINSEHEKRVHIHSISVSYRRS